MMDNVVDASRFPLPEQAAEAQAKRRIGLGVTGLADALLMLGLRYGSEEAARRRRPGWRRSSAPPIAPRRRWPPRKGPFPLFDRDAYLARPTDRGARRGDPRAIAEHGVRNALVTSIAPTGTISLYAGNVSSGIEPIFAPSYTRKVTQRDGTRAEEEVVDYAVALWRARGDGAACRRPSSTRRAWRRRTMCACRPRRRPMSTARSPRPSTCPPTSGSRRSSRSTNWPTTPAARAARPIGRTPSPARSCRPEPRGPAEKPAAGRRRRSGDVVYMAEPLDRPETLPGATYKLKWPASAHAIYVTINDVEVAGRRRPFEIFINSKNMEHYAWTVALTRMISAVFRRGGDVSFVVDELKAVFDPRGGAWMGGRYVPSILAAIGGVIERHMQAIGFLEGGESIVTSAPTAPRPASAGLAEPCEACGSTNMRMIEGCATCADCGFSKCA
jgi:ribonucleoside-diphosphate reductase alpha chain